MGTEVALKRARTSTPADMDAQWGIILARFGRKFEASILIANLDSET
jgi:hypothetical protein